MNTPFAVHYEKIRNHLRETATNSAKIHSLEWKYEHLCINQIQLQFLHFNQHSITLLGIHMGHWAYKREKYTFINANIKVINTILKVNRDNWHTLKCKHYSLTFYDTVCTSIAFLDNLRMDKTNINALVQSIECSLHLIYKKRFSILLNNRNSNKFGPNFTPLDVYPSKTSLFKHFERKVSMKWYPLAH